eukprot:COSAG05_NODE_48_length_24425_cov_90.438543_15_plen_231_part_00
MRRWVGSDTHTGDDSTDPEIGKIIRNGFCEALIPVLNYGFKSFKLFGKHHFWDFLEKLLDDQLEKSNDGSFSVEKQSAKYNLVRGLRLSLSVLSVCLSVCFSHVGVVVVACGCSLPCRVVLPLSDDCAALRCLCHVSPSSFIAAVPRGRDHRGHQADGEEQRHAAPGLYLLRPQRAVAPPLDAGTDHTAHTPLKPPIAIFFSFLFFSFLFLFWFQDRLGARTRYVVWCLH